jgi:hypothetical protein
MAGMLPASTAASSASPHAGQAAETRSSAASSSLPANLASAAHLQGGSRCGQRLSCACAAAGCAETAAGALPPGLQREASQRWLGLPLARWALSGGEAA